ncbi:MAG TPA: hypothetical protein VGO93_10680 [Candidatus Xenobia bacterium]
MARLQAIAGQPGTNGHRATNGHAKKPKAPPPSDTPPAPAAFAAGELL